MDKNTLTGILLIGAIFIAFLILNNEQAEPVKEDKKTTKNIEKKVSNDSTQNKDN